MKSSFAKFFRLVVVTSGLALVMAAASGATAPIAVTADQTSTIKKISNYILSIKNLRGEFTQISPKGNVSRGVFFISRPGKMRFEYAPPNPFVIVADGKWLTVKQRLKDQSEKGDQFPLCETPLRFLLCENVDLLRDTNILGFEQADGLATVTIEERKSSFGGQIVLVFDETRNELQQWIVIDGKGRRTTVQLENMEAGVTPDPKLFVAKINRSAKDAK